MRKNLILHAPELERIIANHFTIQTTAQTDKRNLLMKVIRYRSMKMLPPSYSYGPTFPLNSNSNQIKSQFKKNDSVLVSRAMPLTSLLMSVQNFSAKPIQIGSKLSLLIHFPRERGGENPMAPLML